MFCITDYAQQKLSISMESSSHSVNEKEARKIEHRIFEEKYLGMTWVKDSTLYLDMGLTKNQYYAEKKDAIVQIATALRII